MEGESHNMTKVDLKDYFERIIIDYQTLVDQRFKDSEVALSLAREEIKHASDKRITVIALILMLLEVILHHFM